MNRSIALLLFGLVVLAGGGVAYQWLMPAEQEGAVSTASQFSYDVTTVSSMGWSDVRVAIQAASGSLVATDYAIGLLGETDNPAATYTRALLLLSKGEQVAAHLLFESLDDEEMAPVLLYAPFRTAEQLNKDSQRYLTQLRQAAVDGTLPALIAARILARSGQLELALQNYAGTDPQRWTRYDVGSFRLILMNNGLRDDALKLLSGASSRMDEALGSQFAQIDIDTPLDVGGFASTELGKGASRMAFQTRLLFARGEYQAVLDMHSHLASHQVSNESNLLLFVSAAAANNAVAADRWGLELNRRFSDKETSAWIAQIRDSLI